MRLESTKTVFVLGAGTSIPSGVPGMLSFLDVAYNLRRYTDVRLDHRAFDLVFDAIAQLNSVYAKSKLELRNLESVFAAFEMATLFGRLGRLQPEQIVDLVPSLKTLILETIDLTQRFRQPEAGRFEADEELTWFAALVRDLQKQGHDVTVLTFNYDIGLDFAFQRQQVAYCDGLRGIVEEVPYYLKLHGSLSWAQCPQCHEVTVKPLTCEGVEPLDNRADFVRLRQRRAIKWGVHCAGALAEQPFIVPPTWNKSQHYDSIKTVWRTAADRLESAENIFVIGYSLPETDQFFRYLYALGTTGVSRLQRFWVFNPDESVAVRYRSLLGPIAEERFELNPHTDVRYPKGQFGSAISHVRRMLCKRE